MVDYFNKFIFIDIISKLIIPRLSIMNDYQLNRLPPVNTGTLMNIIVNQTLGKQWNVPVNNGKSKNITHNQGILGSSPSGTTVDNQLPGG